MSEMADLRERLGRASQSLADLAKENRNRALDPMFEGHAARLEAKKSGVDLAISYVDEALRDQRR